MFEILLGVLLFVGTVLALVGVILVAKSFLVASGEVKATRAAAELEGGVALQRVVETDELKVEPCGNTREATSGSGIFELGCCEAPSSSAESGAKADASGGVVER